MPLCHVRPVVVVADHQEEVRAKKDISFSFIFRFKQNKYFFSFFFRFKQNKYFFSFFFRFQVLNCKLNIFIFYFSLLKKKIFQVVDPIQEIQIVRNLVQDQVQEVVEIILV